MPEGLYITKTDFNQLVKKINYLEEYVKNSLNERNKSKWVTPAEAMELLGCRKSKLDSLRLSAKLEWKTSGAGRNIMINRKSIESYNLMNSTISNTGNANRYK